MNPLFTPSTLKHNAVPFNQLKPEHFEPALDQAIAHGRQILEQIKASPASFDVTFRKLEQSTEELEFVNILFNNLLSAHANPELQKLSLVLGPKVASFANDIILDPVIFAKLSEVYQSRKKMGLNDEQLQLVEKVHRDFQRSGAALDEAGKARLREIDNELSSMSPRFRDNLLKATNAFELWITDEKDLAGLPGFARDAAREMAVEKGRPHAWLFTLQRPSFEPLMKYSERRDLREKLYRAFSARAFGGEFDNQPLILRMVELMQEKSRLLGSPSYAHHALALRMAETPDQVMSFLNRLLQYAKPAAEKELAEVRALAPFELEPWDFSYYAEKLKTQKYSFDEETLRPYFKLENVMNGVFEHARRLFGLKFSRSAEYPVYHEDVEVFEVHRETDGSFVGLFYADFFPRESKSQGAWMTNFYEQGNFRGQAIRPHVSIVCNFTKPTADRPSLLNFEEVSTLFHEFGHALHSLLSRVEFRTLAGTNVYLDFVELPSQILENWAEEEESLKLFAFHYKTGELIPQELVDRLKNSQRFLVGYLTVRQLTFAFLDMAWFTSPPGSYASVPELEERATASSRLFKKVDGTNISTGFSHIFGGGYASGYYSYKWAEALEADAFEYFKEKGIFDRTVASRFEEFILSKGGSDHPMRLYEGFRGRKPDPEALLRRDGFIN